MECGHPNFIPFSVGLQYSREKYCGHKGVYRKPIKAR